MLKSALSVLVFVSLAQLAFAADDRSSVSMTDQQVMTTLGLTFEELSQPCVLKAKEQPEKQAAPYKTVPMISFFIQRDISKGLARLTPNQIDHSRIFIKNQRVYNCMDLPVPDSAGEMITYVMDAAGNVYLFDEFTFKKVRHSSVLWKTENGVVQGAEVAGAGEITIKNQAIVMINSDSGHYGSEPVFHQVTKELSEAIVRGATR